MSVHGHCSMGCQRDRYFFHTATQARHRWIALDKVSKNVQFKQDNTQGRKRTAFAKGENQRETAIAQTA